MGGQRKGSGEGMEVGVKVCSRSYTQDGWWFYRQMAKRLGRRERPCEPQFEKEDMVK